MSKLDKVPHFHQAAPFSASVGSVLSHHSVQEITEKDDFQTVPFSRI
jgi:hypothetical protein